MNEHLRHQLVESFSHPVRFSMMAALAGVQRLDFAGLRDFLEISDSALSKQASLLEAEGMIEIQKGYSGKRPRTWFSLTPAGRSAWQAHLATLRAIAEASSVL